MESVCLKNKLGMNLTHVRASGIEHTICTRNVVIGIQGQVDITNESDVIMNTPENTLCQPMNVHIDRATCLGALKRIKDLFEHEVSRKYRYTNSIEIAIECLVKTRHKLQTALSSGAIQFQPPHLTL